MRPLGDTRDHLMLSLGMAKVCGVDMESALREGWITREDYVATVDRCRGCAEPAACKSWLRAPDAAAPPPEYCRNAALFAELRAL